MEEFNNEIKKPLKRKIILEEGEGGDNNGIVDEEDLLSVKTDQVLKIIFYGIFK